MKTIAIMVTFLLLTTPSLSWAEKTAMVAHKGAWSDFRYPQNTLASIRQAVQNGYAGVEFDLQLTQDQQLALGHDDGLARISSCKKPISGQTLAEVKKCVVSKSTLLPITQILLRKVASPQPVSSLTEVLDYLKDAKSVRFIWLDLKSPDPAAARSLIAALSAYPAELKARIVVNSPSLDVIRLLKHEAGLRTSFEKAWGAEPVAQAEEFFSLFDQGLVDLIGVNVGLPFGHEPNYMLNGKRERFDLMLEEFVRQARQKGVPLVFWTLKGKSLIRRYLPLKPDYLLLDRVDPKLR